MILPILLSFIACEQDEEITYSQFNASNDSMSIYIGVEELLPSSSIDLNSTTGLIIVGTAQVDYSGGPVNTTHTFTVNILDEYEDQVNRVSVLVDSGSRGDEEYEMIADSADEGLFQIELVSVGVPEEQREDIFTFRLWEEGALTEVTESQPEESSEPEAEEETQ
jgi:hypothetical protein